MNNFQISFRMSNFGASGSSSSGGGSGSSSSGGASSSSSSGTGNEKEKDDLTLAELLAGGGFAVYPLAWCPHLELLPPETSLPDTVDTKAACLGCGDRKENWLCLHCLATNCSRYVQEHQLHHYSASGHPLALSYSDISVWCYDCDNYVDHELLYPVKNKAHKDKFEGEAMLKPHYGGVVGLELA